MASKNQSLNTVIERFPEVGCQITEFYHQSDFFRSICEDYADCLEVIKRLESSNHMTEKGYKKEYQALLDDLEKELFLKLKKYEDHNHEE
jgi:hypothetical protein